MAKVNQRKAASGGPTVNDGVTAIPFELITHEAKVTDGTLQVRVQTVVNSSQMQFVMADAVAVRRVTEAMQQAASVKDALRDAYVFDRVFCTFNFYYLNYYLTVCSLTYFLFSR